ncbi:putative methyltransferase-domain-containing protein [Mycena amicta]|nr:putative methyltransferase-domain-containing protein [Mycena amicta]
MALNPGDEDPEDILSSSLETLYDYTPITLSSANSSFTFTLPNNGPTITLKTPDTTAANWSLHASSVWVASRFLAEHIHHLDLPAHISPGKRVKLLELGASAGLPGIVIAKTYPELSVVVSDYPDELLIETLDANVVCNNVSSNCRAVPYGWGSDPSELFLPDGQKFDIVIAADTLWNPEFHGIFIDSLQATLKRSVESRIHLFAGLHTGRYTIQSFLTAVVAAGFHVQKSLEAEINGRQRRSWVVEREGEDESERRRWLVCFALRWKDEELH